MRREHITVEDIVLKDPTKEELEELIAWAEKAKENYDKFIKECKKKIDKISLK